ncbi:MAG TPA: TIR domain-containing protein [Pseudonocardiaceae bacterium]
MTGGVFINYRGEDTRSYGVLLYRELSRHLGDDLVFLDSESIEAGVDFAQEILGQVRSCRALLAVIGPRWLTATDPAGRRRIDDPRDWIRRELVAAFTVGTKVIPVLTDDAALPTAEQLPADIAALAGRQFRRLRHRDAGMDLSRIVTEVIGGDPRLADAARRQAGPSREPPTPPGPFTGRLGRSAVPTSDDTPAVAGFGAGPAVRARALRRGMAFNGSSAQTKQDILARTASQLAAAVGAHWQHEEERRKIQDPVPLPVRWRPADEILTDHPKNILRARAGQPADPLDVSGNLDQIADVYQRIPSRRLVVLGRAGSGKTILALRFVLDLLDIRTPGDPVPVIFSMGSWNPAVLSLEGWLISQLIRDHPGLAKVGTDKATLAAELVRARWILPVLDGFDEIAEDLRDGALRELSATNRPLVLTSRPGEYTAAVPGTRGLTLAAVIELTDLTLDDVADYLPRTAARLVLPGTDVATTTWDPVLGRLSSDPESPAAVNLSRALTTPLMVALARTIYSDAADRSATTLLDTTRFSTSAILEEHLLSSFIPSVYRLRPGNQHTRRPRHWNPERAQRWLGYLAGHLHQLGTRDLSWWELGTTMRRSSRALVIAFLAGMTFAVVTAIGNIPVDVVGTRLGLDFALRRGLVVGLLHGLVGGLAFGLMYWFADGSETLKPSPVRIRLFGGVRQMRPRLLPRVLWGIALGIAVALALVLLDRVVVARLNLDDGLGGGLMSVIEFTAEVGIGAGLVLGIIAWLEAPIDITSAVSPADLLKSTRTNVVFHMLVWALVLGLEAGLVTSFTASPLRSLETGLVFALEGAFAGGLGYGLGLTAWGQWVALARIWLPLTRRLPWRLIAFLDDACQQGVLRQAGAIYQFRHARLQDHLTGAMSTADSQQ